MTTISIRIHSEHEDEASGIVSALKKIAASAEGYFAYQLGNPEMNLRCYQEMQLHTLELGARIAEQRPYSIIDDAANTSEIADLEETP